MQFLCILLGKLIGMMCRIVCVKSDVLGPLLHSRRCNVGGEIRNSLLQVIALWSVWINGLCGDLYRPPKHYRGSIRPALSAKVIQAREESRFYRPWYICGRF